MLSTISKKHLRAVFILTICIALVTDKKKIKWLALLFLFNKLINKKKNQQESIHSYIHTIITTPTSINKISKTIFIIVVSPVL